MATLAILVTLVEAAFQVIVVTPVQVVFQVILVILVIPVSVDSLGIPVIQV